MARGAYAQSALFDRLFLTFVAVRRARIKGDGGGSISLETITAAFANNPRDGDDDDDENDDTDKRKYTTFQRWILQE